MKNVSKWMVMGMLALMSSFAIGYNPCAWEVNYVRRINYDLHYMVDRNFPLDEIERKERQLDGALLTLDLCLVAHNLM